MTFLPVWLTLAPIAMRLAGFVSIRAVETDSGGEHSRFVTLSSVGIRKKSD